MEWVDEACGGFFAKEQAGTLKQTDVYLFRVAQMLGDFEAHGTVVRHYSRTVSRLSGEDAAVIARFQSWLRAAERSVSTVRSYGTAAAEFAAFAGSRGGLACCDAATVGAFTATLAGYQAKTVEQKLCALRSFLRFTAEDGEGLAGTATAEAVPVGFHNQAVSSELRLCGWPDAYAARWYSLISPPRTLRRWILAVVKSAAEAVGMSWLSGGRRFLPRVRAMLVHYFTDRSVRFVPLTCCYA
jgi:hypothetical protein